MKYRINCVLIFAALAMSFAACSSGGDEPDDPGKPSVSDPESNVKYVGCWEITNSYSGLNCWFCIMNDDMTYKKYSTDSYDGTLYYVGESSGTFSYGNEEWRSSELYPVLTFNSGGQSTRYLELSYIRGLRITLSDEDGRTHWYHAVSQSEIPTEPIWKCTKFLEGEWRYLFDGGSLVYKFNSDATGERVFQNNGSETIESISYNLVAGSSLSDYTLNIKIESTGREYSYPLTWRKYEDKIYFNYQLFTRL